MSSVMWNSTENAQVKSTGSRVAPRAGSEARISSGSLCSRPASTSSLRPSSRHPSARLDACVMADLEVLDQGMPPRRVPQPMSSRRCSVRRPREWRNSNWNRRFISHSLEDRPAHACSVAWSYASAWLRY